MKRGIYILAVAFGILSLRAVGFAERATIAAQYWVACAAALLLAVGAVFTMFAAARSGRRDQQD